MRTNSTYLDCPSSNLAHFDDLTMSIAVHNPSSVDMKEARFAVPRGKYAAEGFNTTSQTFVDVPS